ncbi:MAG: 1-acyl-sn-glycerol-3-phosphate acyltransferase [Alphaproteobacteria bacterium]
MDQQRRFCTIMATNPPIKEPAAAPRSGFDFAVDRPAHIVDVLIEERAGRLLEHPILWQGLRHLLYPLLKYDAAIRLADAVSGLAGFDVFSLVSRELGIRTRIKGQENIPESGFVFVVANHPTGIADGIAVFDALAPVRPDLCFMANRDAIRVAPGLADMIIPVDWRPAFRTTAKTRETVQGLTRAAREGRAVVIFPSGRLAYMTLNGLRERSWLATTVTLARRYQAPILPLRITSRNSWLYYALATISNELRDITVFNELLNKRGADVRMTFGPPIDPADLPDDPDVATAELQHLVEIDMA